MTKFSYSVGISYSHLKKIEDGYTNIGIETLQNICNALDISLVDFFNDDYFQKTRTDCLFSEINKLTDTERNCVISVIAEINKYKTA